MRRRTFRTARSFVDGSLQTANGPWVVVVYHDYGGKAATVRALVFANRGTMLRANQYWFYDLGAKIHPLTKIENEANVTSVFWPLWEARRELDSTFNLFPLRVSRNAAASLYQAITAVIPEDFAEALKANTGEETIGFDRAYRIRDAAVAFETVLGAELQVLDTYLVSQKGTYSTPDLIDRGECMVPASLRTDLPAQAVVDLQSAGRCLAFNVPTATAFHALRAAESVIRLYYEEVTGAKPKPKMRNWGAYVKRLNECPADKRITGFIDHLRELYRNPVFHPEDNLSADDALVFLGACVTLMCKIILEIQRLRSDPAHAARMLPRPVELPSEQPFQPVPVEVVAAPNGDNIEP